jgi:hypothetical protein
MRPVETDLPSQVGEWYRQAVEALRENDPVCRATAQASPGVRPDAPGLVNNLAVAYGQLGRKEAENCYAKIIKITPTTSLASPVWPVCMPTKANLKQAEALLKPC